MTIHDSEPTRTRNSPYHNSHALALKSSLKRCRTELHVKAVVLKKDPGVHCSLGRGVGSPVGAGDGTAEGSWL